MAGSQTRVSDAFVLRAFDEFLIARAKSSRPLRRRLAGYALAVLLAPVLAILRGQLNSAAAVAVFVAVAVVVGLLADCAVRHAGQAAAAIAESEAARPIAEADRMRTALLAAVSHDLRTPLAAAKAAVSCLRSADIQLTAQDHDELLITADESLDQLTHLLASLLDVSRLQAGRCRCFPGRAIWRRSSRAPSAASGRRHGRSWCAFRPTCPVSWSIRRSWNGSSRTWPRTRCGTPPADRRRW